MSVRRLHPIQPGSFAFTADNLSWARRAIANYPAGKQASAVIPILWRAQEQNEGWVSKPAMEYVARLLDLAFIRVYEIATFYTMFQLSPVGRRAHIQVCGTTPCMLRGAEDLRRVCERKIHHEPHHVSADGNFSWEEVECLGACVNAPMVQIWKDTYEDLTPAALERIIDDIAAGKPVKPGPQIARQLSAPEGGLTSLTDPSLYDGSRDHRRAEPAPPPALTEPTVPPSNAAKPESAAVDTAPAMKTPAPAVSPAEAGGRAAKIEARADWVKAPAATALRRPPEAADGPPRLAGPRVGDGDKLQLIDGIGPKIEAILHGLGIWHFDQIAAWSTRDVKWIDEHLASFKGRATRENWVAQAKQLKRSASKGGLSP